MFSVCLFNCMVINLIVTVCFLFMILRKPYPQIQLREADSDCLHVAEINGLNGIRVSSPTFWLMYHGDAQCPYEPSVKLTYIHHFSHFSDLTIFRNPRTCRILPNFWVTSHFTHFTLFSVNYPYLDAISPYFKYFHHFINFSDLTIFS